MEHAIAAWRATGGRFDPTVLTALEGLGYDRTFEHVASSTDELSPTPPESRAVASRP